MKTSTALCGFAFFCLTQTIAYAGVVGQWVADDWTGGTNNWVDRVGGKIATVASAANSPTKTPGAVVFDGVDDYFLIMGKDVIIEPGAVIPDGAIIPDESTVSALP